MRQLAFITLSILSLVGCDTIQPSKVCGADETVSTVRSLLLQHMVGNATGYDYELIERAFDDTVNLELIRYDGRDEDTGIIRCRASVSSTRVTGRPEIIYTRQPNVGDGGYVYGITVPPSGLWYGISQGVVDRYRTIEQGPPSDSVYDRQTTEPDVPAPMQQSASPVAEAEISPASPTHPEWQAPAEVQPEAPQKHDRVEYVGPPARPVPDPPSPPRTTPPKPSVINNPPWLRRFRPVFPDRALALGLTEGRVMLSCTALPDGRVDDCVVTSEQPEDAGFGPAAILAVRSARITPRALDEAAPYATVNFPVLFRGPGAP